MIYLDSITNENKIEHNEKWPYAPDHPYKIIIIGGSGSGKTNALINLIHEQNNIDKIYLNARDLSEPKYEYMHLNNPNILSSVQIQWMMFTIILMITIQSEKEKN